MKVTVCIPAYNESKIIEQTLNTIQSFVKKHPQHEWQIIVADNGSSDGTGDIVRNLKNVSVNEVLTPGKGAAVIQTARKNETDIFCFIDADLSAAPDALIDLVTTIESGTDVAIGSRLLDETGLKRSFLRTFSSRLFNIFRKVILGINVADSQCGLKAMNKRGQEILSSCTETGWFFDMELLTRSERAGLTIKEISIPWQENVYPERESKLRVVRDGIRGLIAMLRIRNLVSSEKERSHFLVAILLFIATVVYLGFFFLHTLAVQTSGLTKDFLYYERGDSAGYVLMADSILRGDESLVAEDETTRSLRTPGYPIFLAGVFSFTREPLVIVVLQILIALATIPLLYNLGRYVTNTNISFFATLAYILYPTTGFLNTQILAETLFMFFTTLCLWLVATSPISWLWQHIGTGLTAGIAILLRPSFMYVVPLIISYLLITQKTTWHKLISSCIVIVGTILILLPWLHTNQRDYDSFSLSTAGTFNILYVYIPQFLAQKSEAEDGWLKIQQEFISNTKSAGYEIGSHLANDYENARIATELADNELTYFIFHVERSILTFLTSGIKMVNNEMTELGRPFFSATPWLIQHIYTYGLSFDLIKNNSLAFIDAGLAALVTLLIPITVIRAMVYKDRKVWILLLIFGMIAITALLAGPNGNARYRMPVQPYIFLLAFSSAIIVFEILRKYICTLLARNKHV